MQQQFPAISLVSGEASGELLFSRTSLSFWGGVNLNTGQIVDRRHPLCGQYLKGCVLAIPSGRGSCTGSGSLLELLVNGNGPTALIFRHRELILTLGVMVAEALFDQSIPVVMLTSESFDAIGASSTVRVARNTVITPDALPSIGQLEVPMQITPSTVLTSERDEAMLRGACGLAAQFAMEIVVKFAQMQGVERLLDVCQAHVDACIYVGPACLSFAQRLVSMDAKFVVPTTMNSISLDYRRWNELGVTAEVAKPARDVADAYMSMGAKMSFTCAPYLLESAPTAGQHIGWAESNAVVFANSVLGARTEKYPDFLDVCIALTGRAPMSGVHVDEIRRPHILINLPKLNELDDSAYPVIGYWIGHLSGPRIPYICGLEQTHPRTADLKAFCAAFATTASAPMFHIRGITPESAGVENFAQGLEEVKVSMNELATCYKELSTATDPSVQLVSLGSPHLAVEEMCDLAGYCYKQQKHPKVKVVVTTNRMVQEEAQKLGYLDVLFEFGVEVVTDTCWCMLDEPVIPVEARNLMTNSAKYAHYAPGLVVRGVHFGSLAMCVEAACKGTFKNTMPVWLKDSEGK